MQKLDDLLREHPDRESLTALRERILSAASERDLDLEVHRLLARVSEPLLKVFATLTYHVDGEDDHKMENTVWLWSRNDSIGRVDEAGITHYWEGKPPAFWSGWLPVPKYTTSVDDALKLKTEVLGFDRRILLVSVRRVVESYESSVIQE